LTQNIPSDRLNKKGGHMDIIHSMITILVSVLKAPFDFEDSEEYVFSFPKSEEVLTT